MSIELNNMNGSTEDSQPDSPAVPGRADTTCVSRSSTLSSASHAPTQIQLEETEVEDPVEATNGDVDGSHAGDRSIIDQLKECIPKGSNSILERVIHNRSPHAKVELKSHDGSVKCDAWKPKDVWEQVDKLAPSEHSVLVIDEIDDEWSDALCKRYPDKINKRFVLEHILGIDTRSRSLCCRHLCGHADEEWQGLKRSIDTDLGRLDRMFPFLSDPAHENFGGHIYCRLEPDDRTLHVHAVRGCRLSLGSSSQVKINRFLSRCQLQENFCKPSFPKTNSYL